MIKKSASKASSSACAIAARRTNQIISEIGCLVSAGQRYLALYPAAAVEDLYELIQPDSSRNHLVRSATWRNFALVLWMLHEGLRCSETLILAADAVKGASSIKTASVRCWLDVVEDPNEKSDPSADAPTIKNSNSVRKIPISEPIVSVVETYAVKYCG